MELEAAKLVGAGLAAIAIAGVGVGLGIIFSSLVNAIGRNPAARDAVFPTSMLAFALTEAQALFALLVVFLIMYG